MSAKRVLFLAVPCVLLAAAIPAGAKCTVELKFTNNDSHEITVLGSNSQSRINGGVYSKMNFPDLVLAPGATGSSAWTTNMSCGGHTKRDLRFKYRDSGDNNKYEKMVSNVDIDDGVTYTYAIKND